MTRGSSLHGKIKFTSSSSQVHLEKMWNKRDLFVSLPVEASVKKVKQDSLGQTERERKRQKERAHLYCIVAEICGKEKKIIQPDLYCQSYSVSLILIHNIWQAETRTQSKIKLKSTDGSFLRCSQLHFKVNHRT